MAVAPRTRLRRAAGALLASGWGSVALVTGAVFLQRLALPLAAIGLGQKGHGVTVGALLAAAALGFVRARGADRLAARVRHNLLELYLAPFERGSTLALPAAEAVTARLGNAFPTLVTWAVDGVALVLAGLLALPLVTALLVYSLGVGVLVPLAVAGLVGGLLTAASARRVERTWTLAWERSRDLLVSTSAGYAGAVELRAHGRSRAFADRLRAEAARWSEAEGKARIESTLATWGALIGTVGAGMATALLLGTQLGPGRDLYQTFVLLLTAVPTLQTLVAGAGSVLRARDELDEAGRQLALGGAAAPEESDEALDAAAEIALRGIDFAYPDGEAKGAPVLRGLDLRLPAKGSVAVVGPNGAGKSTLLQLLVGVLPPDAGTITVGGQAARLDNRGFRERVAFVSQRPFELPESSVAENLRAFDPAVSDAALVQALETVDLWPALRSRATSDALALALPLAQLSSGQKRRVMLARALLRDADLLVLDEPEAHLDEESVQRLAALLTRLARERRLVAAVHDRALTGFADEVIALEGPDAQRTEAAPGSPGAKK